MTGPPHTDRPAVHPAYAVETAIARRLEDEQAQATLEVTPTAPTEGTLLVGFCGHWGTTTTELTPAGAREFARALERAADHLEDNGPTTEASPLTTTADPPTTAADTDEAPSKTHEQNTESPTSADRPEEHDE